MGIEGLAHDYGTVLILAAIALIVMALVVDFWIAHLRSRHEAFLRTPNPSRTLHVRGFGRRPEAETPLRAGEEAERLEVARQNLESQLGQTLRTRAVKGPALIKH